MSSATEQSYSLEEFTRELAQGRAGWTLFAEDAQGRTLLEVLWLKLGLLHDVLRLAPDLSNLSVRTSNTCHLPVAWTFHVVRSGAVAPAAPDDSGAAELAKAWFGVLLANENQDAARVVGLLARDLTSSPDHAARVQGLLRQAQFSIQNILWHPAKQNFVSPPANLWLRVIDTGVRLATASSEDVPAVVSRAIAEAEALLSELRQLVFVEPPQMRRELTELLDELIADPQWLRAQAVAPAAPSRAEPQRAPAPPPEDMDATVIIKRSAGPAVPPPQRAAAGATRDAGLDETVLMGKPEPARGAPARAPTPPEDLDATIIVGRGERVKPAPARAPAPPTDELDKTIIVSKSEGRVPGPGPQSEPPPPENMDETIILPKDRKR